VLFQFYIQATEADARILSLAEQISALLPNPGEKHHVNANMPNV